MRPSCRPSCLFASLRRSAALALVLGLGVSCTEPSCEPPSAPETSVGTTYKGLSSRQVSAGGESHTCGVTTSDVTYCWGSNLYGQLGDGTTTPRLRPVRAAPPAP